VNLDGDLLLLAASAHADSAFAVLNCVPHEIAERLRDPVRITVTSGSPVIAMSMTRSGCTSR